MDIFAKESYDVHIFIIVSLIYHYTTSKIFHLRWQIRILFA